VCATGAFEDAQQLCAYNKDATVFYELCVLYYSNQDFLLSTRGTSNDDDFDAIFVLPKSPQKASTPAPCSTPPSVSSSTPPPTTQRRLL
jgi:hypothetical protein